MTVVSQFRTERPASADITPLRTANTSWRGFLRSLALTMDLRIDAAGRNALLRATGETMSRLMPLPSSGSLAALSLEMNAILDEIGWGRVKVVFDEAERCVLLSHTGLPLVGSAGDPAGFWLAPALEGLYQGWMTQQPGCDPALAARIVGVEAGAVLIRFGKG